MNELTMRYKGFAFPANPGDISIRLSKNIRTTAIPFGKAKTVETGSGPCTVSGSGCFFGDDAAQQAYRLMTVFRSEGAAWLYAPTLPPMRMYFHSLTVESSAAQQSMAYRFTFTEAPSDKKAVYPCRYTYVKNGENLFDVANRTGVAVEQLAVLNSVKDLFAVTEGEKIWLH